MYDYVRQALTDRTALLPEVQAQLSYFKHLVISYNEWKMDLAIEEYDRHQSAYHYTEDFLCLSCGVNPGAQFLGYDECSECYDEHQFFLPMLEMKQRHLDRLAPFSVPSILVTDSCSPSHHLFVPIAMHC